MTRPNRSVHARIDGGFTLVELLVVIGILSVLVGIFLPVLGKVRQSANTVVCASNLRQWGMATHLYANQNNDCLPRRGQGVSPTFQVTRPTDWFNGLPPMLHMQPYMDLVTADEIPRPGGSPSIWVCPQATDWGGQYYWSYGMNMALSVWEANQNDGKPNKITGVGDTTIMVLLADAQGSYCSVYPSVQPGGYNPVPRHNNYVNICFLDGHVAAVLGSYVGCGKGVIEQSDVQWLPPGSTWNSAY